jgi:cyclopropane-fatty-acyl-phospholipid synthase
LEPTGVEVNGLNPWDIQVHRPELYDRLLREASLGLGESYVEGWWDCQAIEQLITRVLLTQLDEKVRRESRFLLQALKAKLFNRQSRSRAFEVGSGITTRGTTFTQLCSISAWRMPAITGRPPPTWMTHR